MALFSNLFGGPKRPQLESDPENFWLIERGSLSPKFLEEMASGIFVTGPFKFASKAVLSRSSDHQGKTRFAVKSSKGNFVGLTLIRDNADFENLFVAVAAESENTNSVSEIGVHLTVEGDIQSSETNIEWVQINWKSPS